MVMDVSTPERMPKQPAVVSRRLQCTVRKQLRMASPAGKGRVKGKKGRNKNSCLLEHEIEELRCEDNPAYWGEGCFLHMLTCDDCKFSYRYRRPCPKKKEKNPALVYYCCNVSESNGCKCNYTLCGDCWNSRLISTNVRGNKRKRTLFRNANYVY